MIDKDEDQIPSDAGQIVRTKAHFMRHDFSKPLGYCCCRRRKRPRTKEGMLKGRNGLKLLKVLRILSESRMEGAHCSWKVLW